MEPLSDQVSSYSGDEGSWAVPDEPDSGASSETDEDLKFDSYDVYDAQMADKEDYQDEDDKNIGAQIMKKYEEEKRKLRVAMNLPQVSLLDVDESIENIQKERRRIIDNQAVKAKRIDSWIKGGSMDICLSDTDDVFESASGEEEDDDDEDDDDIGGASSQFDLSQPKEEEFMEASQISPDGEIVYDSILKNKEKTKSYWEKLMLAAKLASCNLQKDNLEGGKTKEESVIEREIRMQREREEALANERQAALKLAKYNEEGLHSIPTTDEGNFSESGSDEKEHSLDSSGDADDSFNHQRTPSYESMSSGHSSGSETICRRRSVVRPINEPPDPPTVIRHIKETPIEKEIRLSKEREEELRREKMISSVSKTSKESKPLVDKKSFISSGTKCKETHNLVNSDTKSTKVSNKDDIQAELESISLKKCVSMSSLPMALKNDNTAISSLNPPSKTAPVNNMKNFRQHLSRQSLTNVSTPRLFTPNKGQKGLMKRFLESHGKLPPTFTVATSNTTPVSSKHVSIENIAKADDRIQLSSQMSINSLVNPSVQGVTCIIPSSDLVTGSKEDTHTSRRPGYISAEDKIQMELKEMKKREAELKQERARLLGRSQPNLQDIDVDDTKSYLAENHNDDDECIKLPPMGKLRSALSNPNLFTNKSFVQKPPEKHLAKRRSALIDEWESRIRNEH